MLKQILNPDLYHGSKKKSNFFEGWYFKLVDKHGDNVISIIPGIFYGKSSEDSHGFVQILNGKNIDFSYICYPSQDFKASKKSFYFTVGESSFSSEGLSLNIQGETDLKGTVYFSNVEKWPDSLINPGSMGYYNYLYFMECYSQVCSLSLDLTGSLVINGEKIDFSGGKGYIEKNWGKCFPCSWIWIQCNNFIASDASLSCSIGHIPFLFTTFRGFLTGLKVSGKFYRFTTMNRSKISITQIEHDVIAQVENEQYRLTITTSTEKDKFITCYGPKNNRMSPLVKETLQGSVEIELLDKRAGKLLLSDTGLCTGIEYGGDQMKILD